MPCFDALEAMRPGNFSVAYTRESDDTRTIRPPPRARIWPKAAREHRNAPVRFTAAVAGSLWFGIIEASGASPGAPGFRG
jgi:hypothetical protein